MPLSSSPSPLHAAADDRPRLIAGEGALALARRVLDVEAAAVTALAQRLDADFLRALQLILDSRGRVIVSGVGKSGHIARKMAATLASTGTPSYFVHPAEAAHGDLGMVTSDDVVIALSNSGTTAELLTIMPVVKRLGTRVIAMTGNPASPLAELADVHLDAGVAEEACPLNLAPTASTTAALALGDALAVALLDARGFGPEDFARSHPGGALGRRLLTHVRDVMRSGDAIPRVSVTATFPEALLEMSRKGLGMTAVVDDAGRAVGIFTDGDLRRLLERAGDIKGLKVVDVMHANPRHIGPEALATEAAAVMDQARISQILVVDGDGLLVGAFNTLDLLNAKVI
ncbi:KpsF/GutQ family sugar-phosphate isomerase [Uliginosibacterium sp. H1]|uniref:KpsF/GutQ family sugar-phosphate isomerase n=1 Tax=Uliginosibacterium sp. H1 TaxID=3114757 RepID=UPI002E184792|nr:KpsF/GutQ family sugar-phosphate isomerase [Uliginosibacterium sp. H1]